MKGVIATRVPGHPVVDLTHAIPPQDVRVGAIVLRQSAPWFSKGTVHVAVVDPGVGTERAGLCIETRDAMFVGPDNGLLTIAAPSAARLRTFALDNEALHLVPRSATFHGRDVFAPVAAALAGGVSPAAVGSPAAPSVEIDWPEPESEGDSVIGEVIYVDGFGNLVTNVPRSALPAGPLAVDLQGRSVGSLQRTYADVAAGEPVAVVGSWDFVEIAVRDGSAASTLGARPGTPIRIART